MHLGEVVAFAAGEILAQREQAIVIEHLLAFEARSPVNEDLGACRIGPTLCDTKPAGEQRAAFLRQGFLDGGLLAAGIRTVVSRRTEMLTPKLRSPDIT